MNIPGITKLSTFWDTLRTSYWFVPTLMAAATFLLWITVHSIDIELEDRLVYSLGWIYTGGAEGARELLGVVAGSMITVTGVTFSITIVALTLASQQFGPFLLRNFMRDTGNQVVLGTFISTFIFCLLTLRIIRDTGRVTYVPHLTVSVAVLLTLISLGVLIFFIHHVSVFIQVANIISVVGLDMEEAIGRVFPEPIGVGTEEHPGPGSYRDRVPAGFDSESAAVASSGYGYIKAFDNEELLKVALDHGLIVRLLKRTGDFLGEGDSIAKVWPGKSVNEAVRDAINGSVILGSQRTATQDVQFVFEQMVEIAVRSLSPGINDPFTAIICIDHLGQGLRRMAGREIPSPYRLADDGSLRVIADPMTFAELADTALNQIRHYGGSSAPVLDRLLDTIAAVAPHLTREEDRQALLRHALLIREAAGRELQEKAACSELEERYRAALSALQPQAVETKPACQRPPRSGS